MYSRFCFFAALLVSALSWARGDAVPAQRPLSPITAKEIAQGFRDTTILAKPRSGVDLKALSEPESAEGTRLRNAFGRFGNLRVLELGSGKDTRVTIANLKATGLYEYVEPNYIVKPHVVPNDTRYGEQWALHNTGQQGGKVGADVSAPAAWDIRPNAAQVIVAVIDSGVRATHEDLVGSLWTNPKEVAGNGADNDGNGYVDDVNGINSVVAKGSAGSGNPTDDNGHGTMVASVIGAATNNGKGMAGVAWQTKIMALKSADQSGYSDVANQVTCIQYALANGAQIINMSSGSSSSSQAEYDAVKSARDAGVIIVASAGNDSSANVDVANYPASFPLENIISVANSDRNDALATSSTYGALVELAAPGSAILACTNTSDTAYDTVDGTSFSAPMVSGALALMKAQFPNETYRGLINRLLRSVDPIPALSGKVQTGGRLNILKALQSTVNRPFNDDFANACKIEGDTVSTRGVNIGATAESGEPTHAVAGGTSLWWKWTATRSGKVVVDTRGSSFDTTVAVYTGSAVNALTSIASNDDAPGGTSSRTSFSAVSGTTYSIAVDGKGGQTGVALLSVGLTPGNDDFVNATPISGYYAQQTGTITSASPETGEPHFGYSAGGLLSYGHSVWYKWTAPKSSTYTVAIYTKSFTPVVGVFTGSSVSSLTTIAQDVVTTSFDATLGATYYIGVDGYGSVSGDFTLSFLEADFGLNLAGEVNSSPAANPIDASVVLVDQVGGVAYLGNTTSWYKNLLLPVVDVNTPAISRSGTVFMTSGGGTYAFDASQTVLWHKSYADNKGAVSSPAIAADGTVYVHSDEGILYAYKPDGTERWHTSVPGVSYSSPAIASDGTIYIGSDDHNLYAILPTSGGVKWKLDTGGEVFSSPAIAADGTIYVGNQANKMWAINPNGTQKWTFSAGDSISSSPAIDVGGTIYFGSYDKKVYAVSPLGAQVWVYTTKDQIRASSPAIASDGTVYIGSYDGTLYALTSTGTLKQAYPTGHAIRSSPLIVQGNLIFGSGDENAYFAFPGGLTLADSAWPMFRQNTGRTGHKIPNTAPVINTQPTSVTVAIGGSTTLSVNADGLDTLSFQWYLNSAPISGATQSSYTITNASVGAAGNYTVVITNALGSVTSSVAAVAVASASNLGHLVNLSARAVAGTGSKTLIVGFVVSGGSGTKPLLIRGVGPTLANYSVPGFLADPLVTLFTGGGATISSNDNWATDPLVPGLMSQVGAFAFTSPTSKDAAMAASLTGGAYTAWVTSSTTDPNATGVALAEFYDASQVYSAGTPRLVNISARSQVGQGGDVLIVGFVIGGSTPLRVLIRGVGPGLTSFGVDGVLADPKMELRTLGGDLVQTNDNWGAASNLSEIQAATAAVNAFALGTTSKDAVIVANLQPGAYTAVISGVNNTTGVALAEVYELP